MIWFGHVWSLCSNVYMARAGGALPAHRSFAAIEAAREGDVTDTQASQPLRPRRPSALWWAYFALYVLLFGVTFVNYLAEGHFGTFGAAMLSAALLSLDAVSIAGLYAYIRSQALFAPMIWRIVLILLLARLLFAGSLLASSLLPWDSTREQYVALAGLLSVMLVVPMLVALWRYAFRSPEVWSAASAPHGARPDLSSR